MDLILAEVVKWAVPAVLGGALGLVLGMLKDTKGRAERSRKEDVERMDALCEGVRSLLRAELVRMHERFVDGESQMGLSDMEYLERTYKAYHRLGGNGTGTELYESIVAKFHGKEY